MQALFEKAAAEEKWGPFVSMLGEVFGNALPQVNSFLTKPDQQPSLEHSGIDVAGLEALYATMAGAPVEGVSAALLGAQEHLWRHVPSLPPYTLAAGVGLRIFMVTALNPGTIDPDYHEHVMVPMWKEFAALPAEACELLSQWLSHVSPAAMQNMVDSVQQFITVKIIGGQANIHNMPPPVQWMAMLKEANELARKRFEGGGAPVEGAAPDGRLVPYTAFYNDVVCNQISLQKEFERWMQDRLDHGRSRRTWAGQSTGVFSFVAYPFILDANAKATILELDSRFTQRRMARQGLWTSPGLSPFFEVQVRRDALGEDAMNAIVKVQDKDTLKKPLRVKFFGEEGVDEGGVRKEFFQLAVSQLFSPDFGMFKEETESHRLWFNGDAFEANIQFELLGSLVGLAIYNNVILNVAFPLCVYRKLLEQPMRLGDLLELKPALAKGLQQLLDYEGGDDEDIFALTWTAAVDSWGATKVVPLVEGGEALPVTAENKAAYVDAYVTFILDTHVEKQFKAFKRGFMNVASGPALDLFTPEELKLLVNGAETLNFADLEAGAQYEEPYSKEHPTIIAFWEAVHELNDSDKRSLLKFATGSDRSPIKGLQDLKLTLSRGGPDSELLPTSHTCFNHMLIPEYSSAQKLKDKLAIAIREAEGFGLL